MQLPNRLQLALLIIVVSLSLTGREVSLADEGEYRTGRFTTSFEESAPYADVGLIVHRMFHGLRVIALDQTMVDTGMILKGQAVDVTEESWEVYVPEPFDPNRKYGLFVWIHAIDSGAPKNDWLEVFDELDFIFVGANNSGNTRDTIDRRVPLALHAVHNMQLLYPIDDRRVYVSGMSGGGRLAARLAVSFGDLFTGGYFVSGSEAIGSEYLAVPPLPVMDLVQIRNRLVSYTGRNDTINMMHTRKAHKSYELFCVRFAHSLVHRGVEHANVDEDWLRKGLVLLDQPLTAAPETESETAEIESRRKICLANLREKYVAATMKVQAALSDGKNKKARRMLEDLDTEFGWYVHDEVLQLASKIGD